MKQKKINLSNALSAGALLISATASAQYSPTPLFTGHLGKTVDQTQTVYQQHNPKAKIGAPNVVWILIDDLGFGATSAFGGLIQTPTFDYLANNGLRFNNFHTTSISAPTRASLLTGRNHHSSHVGMFNTDSYGAPGYDSYGPLENGTIAEVLRENGYATFAVGKYNFTPMADGSFSGPFNRWPTSRGFDHFFGYNPSTACDDQWHPTLFKDTQRVPDDSIGQLAISRFADQAIQFIANQKTAAPEQPFFLYFAPGTAHFPHQTTPEWINKYKGKFDKGWDEYTRQTLANQIRLGVVPKNTKLPIRNKDLDKWSNLSVDEQKLFARDMEIYAGYVSQADYEIGRVIDYLHEINQLDNTVIFVALGDNGAEAAGRKTGVVGFGKPLNKVDLISKELKNINELGKDGTYPFYPEGWAAATDTPFRYYKGYADYEGGTHNGLIVFYPNGIKEKGGIRSQYSHVSDVLPTTVELTESKVPETINGYKQTPLEGTSFAYAIKSQNKNVMDQKHIQYYELGGSYAIYKDGWKAQFPNDKVFESYRKRGSLDSIPHLYNVAVDFNESTDLAKKFPTKVKELQDVFNQEAKKYNVYPLKPWSYIDKNAPKKLRKHFDIYFGVQKYAEYPNLNGLESNNFTLTSKIEGGDNGVLYSYNCSPRSDFSFYVKDRTLNFAFRTPYEVKILKTDKKIPSGNATLKAVINTDKETKHVFVTLYANEEKVGEKDLGTGIYFSANCIGGSTLQIGRQWGKSITDDYQSPFIFNGKYKKAIIDIK